MATHKPKNDVAALWVGAEAQQTFWERHYRELATRYPDQFVAVRDGHVICTSPDLMDLAEKLESLGIKPGDVWIEFIAATPRNLVL